MPQFNDPTVELSYLEKDDVLMSGSPSDFANIKAQNLFNRSLTRSALQTLIAASELIIGQEYTITNAVGSTLVLVVNACAVNKLDEIAVNSASGDNVSYDITTDIATPIQQTQINGTGFVKAVGTTLSYDNSTYLTTISGIAASGELAGNYPAPTLVNSAVTGKVLTGLSVTGSAVVSTDSVLAAIGKLQNQVNGLAGGVEYQGTWNASTNTPTLTSSVGTQGFYYVVSVAGTTNLDGITTWELGDWAIFNGTTWQKVDNTDAVVSVNGYTGIVTLAAADVNAVPTSAISGTSGTIPLFGASNTLGNSKFFDDGTNQGTETTTAINRFIISANASIAKIFSFRSGNLPRWAFRVDGTESGANAGADLAIRRYDDAGTFIDAPMTMDRSDGTISVLKDATINGVSVGRGAGNVAGNTAIGVTALNANTTGTGLTAIGYECSLLHTTGIQNTAIGYTCFRQNTSGNYNTSMGYETLFYNSTGSLNVAIGRQALLLNATGDSNVAIGSMALQSNTASNNTAVGFEAGYSNTSGAVTAIGFRALKSNTIGGQNIAIGNEALLNNTSGNYNIAIGDGTSSGNFSGSVIIGINATATAANQFVVGSGDVNVGAVATEVLVSDRSWAVRINGTAYKILLKA